MKFSFAQIAPFFAAEGSGGAPAAPVAPAAPAPAPAPAAPAPQWFDGADTETVGHLQNRGWDKLDPAKAALEAAKAHRNAEHKLGIPSDRMLRLPDKLDDATAMGEVYDRLGRPAVAKDYAFKIPDGMQVDETFQTWARTEFHKLGLSKAQGEALADAWHAQVGSTLGEQQKAHETAVAADMDGLRKEWGVAFEQNDHIAGRAAEALGLTKEEVQGLQAVVGARRTMEVLHNIGSRTMEDSFVGGNSGGGLGNKVLTPAQAQAKISDLRNDDGFRKRLIAQDSAATAEWNRLNAMAVGEVA